MEDSEAHHVKNVGLQIDHLSTCMKLRDFSYSIAINILHCIQSISKMNIYKTVLSFDYNKYVVSWQWDIIISPHIIFNVFIREMFQLFIVGSSIARILSLFLRSKSWQKFDGQI